MEKSNTCDRLNQLMRDRNLRQVDILEMCKPYCEYYGVKLSKSDLSLYVSGRVLPKQQKISMLAMGLNVSEAWLMGLDVPMDKTTYTPDIARSSNLDFPLYRKIERLDDIDKAKTEGFVDALLLDSKYQPKAKEA